MSYGLPLVSPLPPRAWQRALLCGLLALAIGAAGFAFATRVPRERAGDGLIYTSQTINASRVAQRGYLDSYYLQRALAPIAIHHTLALTGQALTPDTVERAFYVLNIAALAATGLLWSLCADVARLSRVARWVGFFALFGNAATLRWLLYYPVLLDATALALGMAMLFAFLTRRDGMLVLATAVGAFCWPTMLLAGLVLLLLPYRPEPIGPPRSLPAAAPWLLGAAAGGAIAALAFRVQVPAIASPRPLLAIGLLAAMLYGAAVAVSIARRVDLRWCLAMADWRWFARLAVAACLYLVARRLIVDYAYPVAPLSDTTVFARYALTHATTAPLLFLVAHLAFFGPILLVLLRFWRRALDYLAVGGPGLLALLGLAALVALTAESRQTFAFYPLAVLAATKALDARSPGRGFMLTFAAVSIAVASLWVPFYHADLSQLFGAVGGARPAETIRGSIMSVASYMIWIPVLATASLLLHSSLRNRRFAA